MLNDELLSMFYSGNLLYPKPRHTKSGMERTSRRPSGRQGGPAAGQDADLSVRPKDNGPAFRPGNRTKIPPFTNGGTLLTWSLSPGLRSLFFLAADKCTDAYLSPYTLFMQGMSGNHLPAHRSIQSTAVAWPFMLFSRTFLG